MAEFALGLTKTAVEGTLSRVRSAIEEEAKLKVKVQHDLMFITGEFQMMQAFLGVANNERTRNEVVRTWVRQVRELAFDVEDCVEFVVDMPNGKSAWTWVWRVVPSCMAPPRHLDQAVGDLKQLKARVEEVSQRNTRYNLISDTGSSSNSKPAALAEQPRKLATDGASAFHLLSEVWKATGKWNGVGDLEDLINSEGQELQVISVWGCGDDAHLGAASIFRKVYNDPQTRQHFKSHAWVNLMHPFSPNEFLKNLLTQFYKENDGDLTKAELMQQLKEHKYLIILEGLSSVVQWDAIKKYLPENKNGSRIIVSTKQLGVALLCTGQPYKVSELGLFSDDQTLCALSKKAGRRSGKGELLWQIRCRGVISVLGTDDDIKSHLVSKVYSSILHKSKQFEGVVFERHSWVDVPVPFNVEVFSRRLLLHFRSPDYQADEIEAVSMMGGTSLTQECCKFLREEDCLVVINGLVSTEDWDSIKDNFLSRPIKGCIVVITNEARVATQCADEEDGALNMKDLQADPMLRPLIKGCQLPEQTSRRGRVFSMRREEACNWKKNFVPRHGTSYLLEMRLGKPGVTSLWGAAGSGKSTLVRSVYYKNISSYEEMWENDYLERLRSWKNYSFEMYSWVDMPCPLNLRDFSQRLLLGFHSYGLRTREAAAIAMMEGQDVIQGCCKFLREQKCLVVIDDLQSTTDWDLIKDVFLSEPIKGCIVVITTEETIATHCADEQDRVVMLKCLEADVTPPPLLKGIGHGRDVASRLFCNRREEARGWIIPAFDVVESQGEEAARLMRSLKGSGVISVWGIAGVGKSSLVRSIYYYIMLGLAKWCKISATAKIVFLRDENFTMYSWVDVPRPFSLRDFCRRLLLDFHSEDPRAQETAAICMTEGQNPVQMCCKVLHDHRSLVVIDGLEFANDWDMIKAALLSKPNKGFIVVITNEGIVATHCCVDQEHQPINIRGLAMDTSLSLFKTISWGQKEMELTDEAELTIAKCGGIHKVIAAIGEKCSRSQLHYISNDFMGKLETDPKFHDLRGLFSWMHSYFDNCSDLLKPCIFYLSVFPPHHSFRRRHLLMRWIAEGYSRDASGSSAEENAERLFSELVNLSIIQPQSNGLCQVNGFFHEYIISRPMEDNSVFALEGNCSVNSGLAGRHLTIRSSWNRDIIVYRNMDLSRLRSLTVFGKWMQFFISTNMSLLRVLDLADASGITNGDLEQIGTLVPRLKFFSVRGCKGITRLPKSLCHMRQLQTLDVRHTSIAILPFFIIKLQKLQYIRAGRIVPWEEGDESVSSLAGADVYQASTTPRVMATALEAVVRVIEAPTQAWSCKPGSLASSSWLSKLQRRCRLDNASVEIPAGVRKLTALHTLGVVSVSAPGGKSILRELKELTQLRKLGVSGITRENVQEFFAAISSYSHLESLSMRFDKDKKGSFLCLGNSFCPSYTLKSLKIYGDVRILPGFIDNIRRVNKCNLEMTILRQKDTDVLSEFCTGTLLATYVCCRLSLWPVYDGELHVDTPQLYPDTRIGLRFLEIHCNSKLQVSFVENMMIHAEVIKVHCYSESSLKISGLQNNRLLKEVWLKGFYGDALKTELQSQLADHQNKPVLKLW